MKHSIRYMMTAVLLAGCLTQAMAIEFSPQTSKEMVYSGHPLTSTVIKANAQDRTEAVSALLGEQTASEDSATTTSGAADPLWYLEVYAVGSSSCGWWEYLDPSDSITNCDHGGTYMDVLTLELGYGSNPIATMNGGQLSSSANYATEPVCYDSYGSVVYPCSAGQTIAGWFKWWDVSGYQNGYFTYQNTSTNSPWNTMSDSISIR